MGPNFESSMDKGQHCVGTFSVEASRILEMHDFIRQESIGSMNISQRSSTSTFSIAPSPDYWLLGVLPI